MTENWKSHPQRNFYNKILLKVEEHEYIYIFEIKLEKIILCKNGGQNKFCDIAQYGPFMLISM